MYKYDEYDHDLVQTRVQEFSGQVTRFLKGELGEAAFTQYRLRNGLYKQIHAHMLRVAIPYGLLNTAQLRKLARIAKQYDKGYGHFTTRQNIQFNWPELKDVPAILQELAEVEMHAIQTSGNCIRNISSDHFAGVSADEIEDPRPYCEMLRQWSTLHPEFYWLPRKFKFAVTGATHDRAAVAFHDIGLRMIRGDLGQVGFQVIVGGGMGRTPVIGKVIREFLPKEYLLSYCEAVLRIYNLHGRRDNKYKARIKILVNELGLDAFKKQVEAEWQRIKQGPLRLHDIDLDFVKQQFQVPEYKQSSVSNGSSEPRSSEDQDAFLLWYRRNTHMHKVANYKIVIVSLKEPGVPPGDITTEQMLHLADLADDFSFGEIRVSHEQNLVLADVANEDLFALWKKLDEKNLATPNIGTLNDMICCPGLDFCSLANASSISIAKQINEKFDSVTQLDDIGEIKVKISGCMNACGHHHAGHIGVLGVDKKGEEWYQFTLGGSSENNARIGDRLGKAVAKHQVADTMAKLVDTYKESRLKQESFLTTYKRIGLKPFQEKVYAK